METKRKANNKTQQITNLLLNYIIAKKKQKNKKNNKNLQNLMKLSCV